MSENDQFLHGAQIRAELRRRMDAFEYQRVGHSFAEDNANEGWLIHKRLQRWTVLKRPKSRDVAFEDRVWSVFAKLNFASLNKNRRLRVQYGNADNERIQVDVLAIDEEVILVIECKSAKEPGTPSAFKQEVEAIQGRRPGVLRHLRKIYPSRKVVFVLATQNYALTPQTVERINNAKIVHLDEDAIEYYLELANHLGNAAKYQLLGNLFANQKIPGLDPLVPAMEGKMGGHRYFTFMIEPARLLKLAYVLHRTKANSAMMPTYQRLIKKARLKKTAEFVDGGGYFPNSLLINIDARKSPQFDRMPGQDATGGRMGMLHLPQTYRAAYVIDGQHRLYGFANSSRAETELIPVIAFVGLERAEQVRLFMQINENQQAVPKNLRNTLNADLLGESDDLRERHRALKLRIAQGLGEDRNSPLYGRVIVGEEKIDNLRCITIDAISNGLERGNFLGSFTKSAMQSPGTFHVGSNDATYERIMPFLFHYFRYVREQMTTQWGLGKGDGGFVFINGGIESLLRIASDFVDHAVAADGLDARRESAGAVFAAILPKVSTVVNHLESLSSEEALDLKRSYGTAGRARYWRKLQIAAKALHPEFAPAGLSEYESDEARAFNTETFAKIMDIERHLNRDIRTRLQFSLGSRWFKDGVPPKAYRDASSLAAEKNREKDFTEEVEPWDCLHLSDYQHIFRMNFARWQELFEEHYSAPDQQKRSGGWKTKTDWLDSLIKIRNENSHTYSVKESEYNAVVTIHNWLMRRADE